ncbi:hypothetical protein CAEBREN_26147 [Caenorhabditis brenneri]|uniref:Uncharacterized protein n=1 Tax=Caenorhabditis brenneri TaxID=135651 RepID=G0MII0_CAEBE|nr:hypothetical protein CAEBREN_26147 [Caenorhabditis brenneri]
MSNETESSDSASSTTSSTTGFKIEIQPYPDVKEIEDLSALNFLEEEPANNGKSWDGIETVDHDSPLSVLASYYLQRRFEGEEDLLKSFNRDITETMETVARFSPTARPIVGLVNQIDREGLIMKDMKKLQGHYLALMHQDKNAEFCHEMMKDHSDPRVIFYLRELATHYYNAQCKSGRLAKQKKKELNQRDMMKRNIREHNYQAATASFERGTVVFYQECEAIQKAICKEIFELLDIDIENSNRETLIRLFIEWRKESTFDKPIKGVRNIYLDEYQKIEENLIRMTHECHSAFETQMINRLAIEEDSIYNEDNMSKVKATLFRLHKKVAAIVLVEAQTSWTDFEERIDCILKVQQQIQEAQVETLNMDHKLLQQLINFAENNQNQFIPEYPLQEMEYQKRNKEIFIERTNKKLDALYKQSKEDEPGIGTYEEMKEIAFEEEMEQYHRNIKAHEQELNDAAVLLSALARDIKHYYKVLNVARSEQRVTMRAEAARVARLEAANAARAAKIAEAKAKKQAAKAKNNGKSKK